MGGGNRRLEVRAGDTVSLPPPLSRKFSDFRRTTYVPVVEAGPGEERASRFGGQPWLPTGEDHPVCPHCHRPMPLLLQLRLDQTPSPLGLGSGLLQLFYCLTEEPFCEVECGSWAPFSESVLPRVLDASGPGRLSPTTVHPSIPAWHVVAWAACDDFPNWEEAYELDVELTDREEEMLDELFEASGASVNRPGDKLAGWPYWIQGVEYPDCPDCGEQMEFLFQLDSEDHLPFMFGDCGCGHITRCPSHPEQLAFGWACH